MNLRGFCLVGLVASVLCMAAGSGFSSETNSPSEEPLPGGLADLSNLTGAQSRSVTAENPTGEKGRGGMAVPNPGENKSPAAARAADNLGQGWKVRPFLRVNAGETATLMDVDGPGVVQHIFMSEGLSRAHVLRFYWDGEATPSVEVPAPDFFAVGHEKFARVNSQVVVVNPANALHCYWPMPFKHHARVTFANEGTKDLELLAFQIDYSLTKVPDQTGYFHAQWRQAETAQQNPYVILDGVQGKGRYVGTFLAWTQRRKGWFGEGEVKFYLDGDTQFPTICGTGTEDYFGSSYGFAEPVSTAYSGTTLPADYNHDPPNYWSLYRWHIPDPISFNHDLKVTIQALGWGDDGKYKLLSDHIASVAYWYQAEPHAPFPPLPPVEQRVPVEASAAPVEVLKPPAGYLFDPRKARVTDSRGSVFTWRQKCDNNIEGDHTVFGGWQSEGDFRNFMAYGTASVRGEMKAGIVALAFPDANRLHIEWPITAKAGQKLRFTCCLTDRAVWETRNGARVRVELSGGGVNTVALDGELKPGDQKVIQVTQPLTGTENKLVLEIDNCGSEYWSVVYCDASLEDAGIVHVDEAQTIQNETVRIQTVKQSDGLTLRCQARKPGDEWHTVLEQVAPYKTAAWEGSHTALEDLQIAPGGRDDNQPFFTEATVTNGGQTLVLHGQSGVHQVEQTITLEGEGRAHVVVRDALGASPTPVERVMSHFYFMPDGRSMGHALPTDFAWLPSLHRTAGDISGDWTFRSPAAIIVARGLYAAIVPDLDILAKQRDVPQALDLRCWEHSSAGTYGLPRLSYGLCNWKGDGHVYMAPAEAVNVSPKELSYGFDLLLGVSDKPDEVTGRATRLMWDKYGRVNLQDIRPQVLPFDEYGRKYSYVHELKRWATRVELDGKEGWGINNAFRHGANFTGWENDLHVGFGIWHYGDKWGDDGLRRIGQGIMRLSLAAPRKEGAFPCIFDFGRKDWEGSLYWSAAPAWASEGYDAAAMGVSAWWRLYWLENFKEFPQSADVKQSVVEYAKFLAKAQLPSGAIPTYYDARLRPGAQLKESAITAISGAVLAKTALLTKDNKLKEAALAAGRFMEREILPKTLFQDFEVFYSCAPKPLYWLDPVNGIPPVDTLAIQWSADQFLALYRLTGATHWLEQGKYCLGLLSLFQQVWSPPALSGACLFGGFGVQNTDGEWSDGRQPRFVSTYADYYEATGNLEYLERAVAVCRASFAAMDIAENHLNGINHRVVDIEPGAGFAPENLVHDSFAVGGGGGWTGFDWGAGGAQSGSAYMDIHFGSVWVDGEAKQVVPIDGAAAKIISWDDNHISLEVKSALNDLPHAYDRARELLVKFGFLPKKEYTITINGKNYGTLNRERLKAGILTQIFQ
jgi:hypothetical protein